MAFNVFKVIQGLLVQQAGTLTPSAVQITPGGTASTTTTLQGAQTANRTLTLPDATDTLTANAATQTLTNKTLGSTNTATGINMASFTPDGGAHTLTAPAVTDTLVGLAATQTLTNKTLSGNTAATLISGSGTLTLNTSGTITVPSATDQLVGRATTDTLTNKTLTSPTINTPSISGSGGALTLPAGPDTLVGRATTDTLTNKTLTSPVINTPSISGSGGALTLPAGPDTLVGRATTDTLTNKTLTNPNITNSSASNTETLQVPNATASTLAGLTRVAGNVMYATDTKQLLFDNGTQLVQTGGISAWQPSYAYSVGNMVSYANNIYICTTAHTSSSVNFETDSSNFQLVNRPQVNRNLLESSNTFEAGTIGTMTTMRISGYTAGTVPSAAPTLSGGSSVTLSAQSTGSLTGSYSLQMTTSTTFSAGDGFISPVISVDTASQGKMHTISFDYAVTAGASNLNLSGTKSNTFYVLLWDATHSVWITPTPSQYAINATSGRLSVQVQMPVYSSTMQVQVAVLVANANTSGTTTVLFDNFFLGLVSNPGYGMAGSDWASYTPSFTGMGTGFSNVSFFWRRVGDSVEIAGNLTTGSSPSGTISFTMPNGIIADSSKISSSVYSAVGNQVSALGYSNVRYTLAIGGSNNLYMSYSPIAGLTPYAGADANAQYNFNALVPIQGWSSSSQIVSQYDGRAVAVNYNTLNSTSMTANTNLVFTSKVADTHGAYNTSTGVFTAPVSGIYSVSGFLYTLSSSATTYFVSKNGSSQTGGNTLGYANSSATSISPLLIACNAGDTLALQSSVSVTIGNASYASISINLISGAQQILAGQRIAAEYYVSTNQSVSGNTQINFDTMLEDTVGAVTTGSSWKFTAPVSGDYLVTGSLTSATGSWTSSLWKNGTQLYYSAASAINYQGVFVYNIKLNAGDYIDLRTGGSVTFNGSSAPYVGYIKIKQV